MVPKRLKKAREAAGFSQEKLSQLIGVEGVNSRSRLSSYEVGRSEPPFRVVVKIAKILNCPENYFYTINDEEAEMLLLRYKNQTNPNHNPYFNSVVEVQKLTAKLDDAKKVIAQIEEPLKRLKNTLD